MTLEDLGNLSEIVEAIAVVISLVCLAVQVRQNTAQIRESSKVSRLLLQSRALRPIIVWSNVPLSRYVPSQRHQSLDVREQN